MSFNKECIFCLELLKIDEKDNCKIQEDYDYTLQDKQYKNKLLDITNTNIKLKCHHLFHLECFFLYIKFNSKILNDLKCPLCRYNILKNDIRKILILYFILLKKLRLKIGIDNLCNFLKLSKSTHQINDKDNFYETLNTSDKNAVDKSDKNAVDTSDTYDTKFLKNKICFRSRQIIKLVLMY